MTDTIRQASEDVKDAPLVLLFDGLCGFCDKTVQHIFKHDKKGTLKFAPLQSDFAQEVLDRHPRFRTIDSMILIERHGDLETAYARSAAALKLASYLGGYHKLFLAAKILPPPLRDVFYKLFAKNRYKLFGKKESCPIPTREQRARFVAMPTQ
jgi:predicted DCC family thiol-disulfide oxidoreductase YuxK